MVLFLSTNASSITVYCDPVIAPVGILSMDQMDLF